MLEIDLSKTEEENFLEMFKNPTKPGVYKDIFVDKDNYNIVNVVNGLNGDNSVNLFLTIDIDDPGDCLERNPHGVEDVQLEYFKVDVSKYTGSKLAGTLHIPLVNFIQVDKLKKSLMDSPDTIPKLTDEQKALITTRFGLHPTSFEITVADIKHYYDSVTEDFVLKIKVATKNIHADRLGRVSNNTELNLIYRGEFYMYVFCKK